MKLSILIILSLIFALFCNSKNAGGIPSDLDSANDVSSLSISQSILVIEKTPRDSARSKPAPTKTMRTLMKKTEYLFMGD